MPEPISKFPALLKHLEEERFLKKKTIVQAGIEVYTDEHGEWFAIPIDKDRYKLHRAPSNKSKAKCKYLPSGGDAILYDPLGAVSSKQIFICEGEFDCLLLNQSGFSAVSSSSGAQTWDDGWDEGVAEGAEIVLIFDNDEAGEKGREKVRESFKKKRPDVLLADVFWHKSKPKGYDVTDAYKKAKEDKKSFSGALEKAIVPYVTTVEDTVRKVAKLQRPRSPVEIDAWREVIEKNFPDLVPAAETCLSVVAQLLMRNVHNCFALVLVDAPSSGKTICLNFFVGLEELIYTTDNFSPAALVSHAANKKTKDLEEIDMLPKIRFKTLVIRELAGLFSEREDILHTKLGILTRVLDGEGWLGESGVHGGRGYQGDYLFMFLGASTPISYRVWKQMRVAGHRLFFLGTHIEKPTKEQLVAQVMGTDFKTKERACKKATHEFLRTLWGKYPDGIEWDCKGDNEEAIKWIADIADFTALMRGDVAVYKDKNEMATYENTRPEIEHSNRAMQAYTNLARGHALVCGREKLSMEDVPLVLRIALDTAQDPLPELILTLLRSGGMANLDVIQKSLRCGREKAKREAHKLVALGICESDMDFDDASMDLPSFDGIGQKKKQLSLRGDFLWLLDAQSRGWIPDCQDESRGETSS